MTTVIGEDDGLTYDYTDTTLTISGTGAMLNLYQGVINDSGSSPVDVTGMTVCVISAGVTSICNLAFCECTSLTSLTIGDDVTYIGQRACDSCTSLTTVTIGSGVTTIGSAAFYDCTSLESIVISAHVSVIDNASFYGCVSLASVTIEGNALTTIGMSAFHSCSSLVSITLPNLVTSIGNTAFTGCTAMTSMTCNAITPPTLGLLAIDTTSLITIAVPYNSVNTYKSATNWSNYSSYITSSTVAKTYYKLTRLHSGVQVDSAIRDGDGRKISTQYVRTVNGNTPVNGNVDVSGGGSSGASRYMTTLTGDGGSSYTITHNLNKAGVVVLIYDSSNIQVYMAVTFTSNNSLTLSTKKVIPVGTNYSVVVIG